MDSLDDVFVRFAARASIWFNFNPDEADEPITVYCAVPNLLSPWRDACALGWVTGTFHPDGNGEIAVLRLTAAGKEVLAENPL